MCITVCIYTVFRLPLTGFRTQAVENSLIMLKIIKTMGELNTHQLMAVYAESIRENCERFSMEMQQGENAFLDYLSEDFFRQKGAFYAAWSVEDVYQCALRLEPYADGLLLEALETAPHARRQGYATALMQAVLEHLQTKNQKAVYSHVNKRNKASLNLHKKCGFAVIADSAKLLDGTVTQNYCTLCYRL